MMQLLNCQPQLSFQRSNHLSCPDKVWLLHRAFQGPYNLETRRPFFLVVQGGQLRSICVKSTGGYIRVFGYLKWIAAKK